MQPLQQKILLDKGTAEVETLQEKFAQVESPAAIAAALVARFKAGKTA